MLCFMPICLGESEYSDADRLENHWISKSRSCCLAATWTTVSRTEIELARDCGIWFWSNIYEYFATIVSIESVTRF